jgi:hypothetical protein
MEATEVQGLVLLVLQLMKYGFLKEAGSQTDFVTSLKEKPAGTARYSRSIC